MLTVVSVLILMSLSFQVFPVAVGINQKKDFVQSVWFASLLMLGQLFFFLVGYLLGDRFMHLMAGFKGVVIFIGFFLIGIRMIMEAFTVIKGERTYIIENTKTAIMASAAQGTNTFLAALLFTFLPVESQWLMIVLVIFSLIVTFIALFLKPGKRGFTLSSMLFFFGGLVMVFSSVYLGFFYE